MLLFTLRESINSRGFILKNEINVIFSVPCTFGIRSTYFDSASEGAAVAAFLIGLDTRLKTEPLKKKEEDNFKGSNDC